jgi:site-specific recombinase XerC
MERAKAYRCLSSTMTRALRLGEITSQPWKVDGASLELEKKRPLPGDDVPWRMAQALRDYTDKYGRHSRDRSAAIPLFIGYGTGNRKSEVRGPRRRDMPGRGAHRDRATGVFHWWQRLGHRSTHQSKKGNRIIFVYEAALDALRHHAATYMRPAEEDPLGNDLVFTGPTGGPISDCSWDLAWRQACTDAGVDPDLRLHDIRHLAATSVAEDTKDLKHIQEYLGDSRVVAAMRYLSVTDESKRQIGRAMGQRFRRYAPADTDNVVPLRQANW